MIFGMIFMLVSSAAFGFIIGSIVNIMNKQETLVADLKLQRTYINQFLVQNKVPKSIKIKIKNYLDYLIDYKRIYKLEEQEVIEMLNENL